MHSKKILSTFTFLFIVFVFSCTEEPVIVEYPPVAVLEVTPLTGDTSTVFTADASQSYDEPDPISALEYQFNWGDSEIWSDYSLNSISTHQYDSFGDYIITVRVIDTSGWTNTDMLEIEISEN